MSVELMYISPLTAPIFYYLSSWVIMVIFPLVMGS
jgi:hypothetical protein